MKHILLQPLALVFGFMLLVILPINKAENIKRTTVPQVKRVISLSPSITRAIVDLGAEDMLVGVTTYHPPLKKKKAIIGTVVQSNIELIALLKPDIVFTSREDNKSHITERLNAVGIRTHSFDANNDFALISAAYLELAMIVGKKEMALEMLKKYQKHIDASRYNGRNNKVALFISHQPLMGISGRSFIGNAISDAGGINVFALFSVPYPIISIEHVIALNPDVIITIMHDGVQGAGFFYQALKDFPGLSAIKRKNIYAISPETTCYYTPGVYAQAVVEIANILKKSNKGLMIK